MYDRRRAVRWAGIVLPLAIAAAATTPAVAQTSDEYRARLEKLAERWKAARVAAARARSLQVSAVRTDTIVVGTLAVITRSGYRDIARDATGLAWETLRATLGSDVSLLRGHAFYTEPNAVREPSPVVMSDSVHGIAFHARSSAADIADRIVRAAGSVLTAQLDDTMRQWLGGFDLRLLTPRDADWSQVYIELATGRSRAARECYVGDLEVCRYALGLSTVEDPATRLYNAEERRHMVGHMQWRVNRHPDYSVCVDADSDAACLEVLRSAPELIPLPLSPDARRSILQLALEAGGDRAFGRLSGLRGGSAELTLAAVAGTTSDSLLALWHDRVTAARPYITPLTWTAGWMAFAWVVAFAVIASRSTRWRLG